MDSAISWFSYYVYCFNAGYFISPSYSNHVDRNESFKKQIFMNAFRCSSRLPIINCRPTYPAVKPWIFYYILLQKGTFFGILYVFDVLFGRIDTLSLSIEGFFYIQVHMNALPMEKTNRKYMNIWKKYLNSECLVIRICYLILNILYLCMIIWCFPFLLVYFQKKNVNLR